VLQLTKVADELHQVIAQKNKDLKRLKDMYFIEFNKKNTGAYPESIICGHCGNNNHINNYSNELVPVRD